MSKLKAMLDKYRNMESMTLRVGIIETMTYPDGMTTAQVGLINEYGAPEANIPARPFFRTAIEDNRKALQAGVAKSLAKDGPEIALAKAGQFMSDAFTESVQTWTDPPNAPSTIKAKGFDAPLRAKDRLLRKAFSYEIVND